MMGRYLSLLANVALFVTACFLVAKTANAVFAALLTPAPGELATEATASAPATRSWSELQVILSRNLFNASLVAPTAPLPPIEEDLEATRLPLRLLGTAAVSDPDLSWAAVENLSARTTTLVRIDEEIANQAMVVRIERRRIVISENGTLRELAFEDDETASVKPPRSPSRSRPKRPARSARRSSRKPEKPEPGENIRRLAENRYAMPRSDVDALVRNPAALFSQARVVPKYAEDGEMLGVQINSIKPGSLWEEIGVLDGDVVTELNGLSITSAEQRAKAMQELTQAAEVRFVIDRAGQTRTVSFEVPEE